MVFFENLTNNRKTEQLSNNCIKSFDDFSYFYFSKVRFFKIFHKFSIYNFDILGTYNCACGGGFVPDSTNRKKCSKIEGYEDSSGTHYYDSSYSSYDNDTIVRRYSSHSQSELLTGIFIERCAPGSVTFLHKVEN